MLADLAAAAPSIVDEEEPTAAAKAFYRMIASAEELVHDQTTHSTLSATARLISIKSQYNLSIACYNDILALIEELLPADSKLPKDFYYSKKMLEGLGLPYQKIHVCYNNCMLYYGDNKDKLKCDICNTPRYVDGSNEIPRKILRYLPITERLQRLYVHEKTAKLMRWHKEAPRSMSGRMDHPRDGEAWQQFEDDFVEFAQEPRNVRLGLATDGFTPYSLTAASYSCWPVFVIPYNLPPGVAMRPENIFLSLVIPGPEHPGKNFGVLMQPLVDELKELMKGVKSLRQISYGFSTRVSSYGCYDINGYRFRSEKYEHTRAGLGTTNSGVCVSSFDENGGLLEYFGVIKDIIKISWQGSMKLELVLLDYELFDPTTAGVRRTDNLGLVEIKHSSRLSNFEPFVLASQVKQVYFLPYACNTRKDLSDWWVVYHVAPRDWLLPVDSNTESDEIGGLTEDVTFFQEEGLEGTFVIDLGVDLDNSAPLLSDEIVDEKELEILERQGELDDSEEIIEEDYANNETDEELDVDYDEEDY
jgi:hypothetical protein